MRKYIFDRNEFNWSEEFYKLIKDKFNFPEWFGENADALWDMLTGFIETPCEVVFTYFIVCIRCIIIKKKMIITKEI